MGLLPPILSRILLLPEIPFHPPGADDRVTAIALHMPLPALVLDIEMVLGPALVVLALRRVVPAAVDLGRLARASDADLEFGRAGFPQGFQGVVVPGPELALVLGVLAVGGVAGVLQAVLARVGDVGAHCWKRFAGGGKCCTDFVARWGFCGMRIGCV